MKIRKDTYPVGLVIKNKYYIMHLTYPGAHVRPMMPWAQYASIVVNLTDKIVMLSKRSPEEPRRKSNLLTRAERGRFNRAIDITKYENNENFFKSLVK